MPHLSIWIYFRSPSLNQETYILHLSAFNIAGPTTFASFYQHFSRSISRHWEWNSEALKVTFSDAGRLGIAALHFANVWAEAGPVATSMPPAFCDWWDQPIDETAGEYILRPFLVKEVNDTKKSSLDSDSKLRNVECWLTHGHLRPHIFARSEFKLPLLEKGSASIIRSNEKPERAVALDGAKWVGPASVKRMKIWKHQSAESKWIVVTVV